MKKKVIAIITTIISLLALSVNTFALSTDNTLSKTSYRSWSNISGIEILYDDYSTTLDYTGEIEEDTPDAENRQQVTTNSIVVGPSVQWKLTPGNGEWNESTTHIIDFPTFRVEHENTQRATFNQIEVTIGPYSEVLSIRYLSTESTEEFTAFVYPAWNTDYSRTMEIVGGRATWFIDEDIENSGDYAFVYDNTFHANIHTGRARLYIGNLAINDVDGDYMNFTQSFLMRKTWATGIGSPIIYSFQSKNAVFYPSDIEYDSRDSFDTILPTFALTGARQDNTDTTQSLPYGWETGEYAKTDIEYTYFLRQRSANGEYYVTQYRGSQTIYQYPNQGDFDDKTHYYILPHPSMIFSEEIYSQLEGIIYENTTTRIYTSRALNNYDFEYTDTLMRDVALQERSVSYFMENVRYYPTEQLHFSDLSIFLTSVSDGFFNTNIFGLFSISDILFVMIAIALLVVFLKMFAGG